MKKVKLSELKVNSFVTSMDQKAQKTLKGGGLPTDGCFTQAPTEWCPTSSNQCATGVQCNVSIGN